MAYDNVHNGTTNVRILWFGDQDNCANAEDLPGLGTPLPAGQNKPWPANRPCMQWSVPNSDNRSAKIQQADGNGTYDITP